MSAASPRLSAPFVRRPRHSGVVSTIDGPQIPPDYLRDSNEAGRASSTAPEVSRHPNGPGKPPMCDWRFGEGENTDVDFAKHVKDDRAPALVFTSAVVPPNVAFMPLPGASDDHNSQPLRQNFISGSTEKGTELTTDPSTSECNSVIITKKKSVFGLLEVGIHM
jgi:hypothetical protein